MLHFVVVAGVMLFPVKTMQNGDQILLRLLSGLEKRDDLFHYPNHKQQAHCTFFLL